MQSLNDYCRALCTASKFVYSYTECHFSIRSIALSFALPIPASIRILPPYRSFIGVNPIAYRAMQPTTMAAGGAPRFSSCFASRPGYES